MNRNVHRQIQEEHGVDIREPSTACFLIDSLDRGVYNYYTATDTSGILIPGIGNLKSGTTPDQASNFTINSLQNNILGHFTRMAVQEVAMDWGVPNVAQFKKVTGFNASTGLPIFGPDVYNNSIFNVDISGVTYTGQLPARFYTIYEVMNQIKTSLNAVTPSGVTFSLVTDPVVGVILHCTNPYLVVATNLSIELGFLQTTTRYADFHPGEILAPMLMPWVYVDITCPQLTYCQDVKDATTNPVKRDVLYRWYLSENTGQSDAYGFPILMGYQNFRDRRPIAFPKQIKWDPIQQVTGSINFVSYATLNTVTATGATQVSMENFEGSPYNAATSFGATYNYDFQMTLLLSEV